MHYSDGPGSSRGNRMLFNCNEEFTHRAGIIRKGVKIHSHMIYLKTHNLTKGKLSTLGTITCVHAPVERPERSPHTKKSLKLKV